MRKCEKCKEPLVLNMSYDAYMCVICNEWKEEQCGDPKCHFCVGRKENPFNTEHHNLILEVYKKAGFEKLMKSFEEDIEQME